MRSAQLLLLLQLQNNVTKIHGVPNPKRRGLRKVESTFAWVTLFHPVILPRLPVHRWIQNMETTSTSCALAMWLVVVEPTLCLMAYNISIYIYIYRYTLCIYNSIFSPTPTLFCAKQLALGWKCKLIAGSVPHIAYEYIMWYSVEPPSQSSSSSSSSSHVASISRMYIELPIRISLKALRKKYIFKFFYQTFFFFLNVGCEWNAILKFKGEHFTKCQQLNL